MQATESEASMADKQIQINQPAMAAKYERKKNHGR